MPGPKGYFETVSVSDEPAPPGAHDVITYTTLTANRIVVGAGTYTVTIGGATLSNGGGGAADLKAIADAALRLYGGDATGGSGNLGGAIEIQPGNPDGANTGANVTIYGGNGGTTGDGGVITIQAGGATSGVGGGLVARGGTAGGANGGGYASFEGGSAGTAGTGGDVHLVGGPGGSVSGAGGPVYIEGGVPTDGSGGSILVAASAGVGTNRNGGGLNLNAGASTGNQDGGLVAINGGAGGTGGTGNGGAVAVTGGLSATGATGNGGAVTIAGGAATSTDGSGGAVTIAGGVGTGTGLRGTINFTGSLTLNTNEVTLNSNQNNYTGGDGYGVLKINATGNFDLTGLANPVSGRQLIIYNTGASTVTLKHDATSTAANRFYLPGATDLAIAQYSGVIVEYAPTITRWVVVGMSVSSSSGSAGLANVAYVSKGGNDGTAQLGSISKPYLTIQAAINAAAAAATPYTIEVGPGTFTENLTWSDQLSLNGAGSRETFIVGTFSLVAAAAATALSVNISNVNISGAGTLNYAAKTGGDVLIEFNNCILGSAWTGSRPALGAYTIAMYDTRGGNALTPAGFNNVIVVGSSLGSLVFSASGGSEVVKVLGCSIDTITISGAGSTAKITGTVVASALNYTDGFGGTLTTSGCDLRSATVTYTSGTWRDSGSLLPSTDAGLISTKSSSSVGGAVSIVGGTSSATGGAITVTGGAGTGANNGGAITITGGSSPTNTGGALTLSSGGATGNGGAAGNVTINTGAAAGTNGDGGRITIKPGDCTRTVATNSVTITGGESSGNATGGAVTIAGGRGGAAGGVGGAVSFTGGAALSGNNAGGASSVTGGAAVGSGTGGAASLTGGAGGSSNGAGGPVTIAGGAAGATNANGGSLTLRGGALAGTGANGAVIVGDSNTSGVQFGTASPAQLTGNVTDYTGTNDCMYARLTSDASRTINTIAGQAAGRRLVLVNIGSQNIVLLNDDGATGTAAMRILTHTGANYTIAGKQCVELYYDGTSSRWRTLWGSGT